MCKFGYEECMIWECCLILLTTGVTWIYWQTAHGMQQWTEICTWVSTCSSNVSLFYLFASLSISQYLCLFKFFLLLSLQLYFILFIYVLILFLQKAVQRSTHNWHSASMCTKMLKDIASLPLVWTLHLEVFKCRLIVRESPLVPFLHSVLAFIEIWQFDLVLNVETPPAYINLPLLSVLTSASCESCLVHSNIASYLISLSTSLSDQSVYDLLP